MSLADLRRVPLNSMCSMKCDTRSIPWLVAAPTPTHTPRLVLAICGISAVTTVRPFEAG
jgi:hypothetical protein